MTNMRKRERRRQYFGVEIAAVYPSNDRRKLVFWQEHELLSCAGSPP
jgi:hypothetical protein